MQNPKINDQIQTATLATEKKKQGSISNSEKFVAGETGGGLLSIGSVAVAALVGAPPVAVVLAVLGGVLLVGGEIGRRCMRLASLYLMVY
jgi:hypothetical protein